MIRVTLGPLARSGVESHFGCDFVAGVRAAVVYYAGKLRSGRLPLPPPRFLPAPSRREARIVVDLTIDVEDEAVFKRQALRRGTTVGELARHAVLVYLAELEMLGVAPRGGSGREPGAPG